MINLRYHIVSIVAVFLALAIGVVMGSTVIARSELDLLRNRQDDLESRSEDVRRQNVELQAENEALRTFQEEAENPLLAGDLTGIPVVVIAIRGIEQGPADELRRQLANAGARSQGTIWLTRKLRLDNQADVESLAAALRIVPGDAAETRREAIDLVAGAVLNPTAGPFRMEALREAGFLEIEAPAASAVTTTSAATESLPAIVSPRVVVVSGAGAEMSDDEVALPLVRALAARTEGVVAAEAGNEEPGGREVFVGPLRRDSDLAPGISTVDNLEAFAGRAALVVLLRSAVNAPGGHYGVGPQAEHEVPPVSEP